MNETGRNKYNSKAMIQTTNSFMFKSQVTALLALESGDKESASAGQPQWS